jgi:TIGR00255 family protein
MTGYGKAVTVFNGKKIHAEIKSLNSKALDLSTRIAPLYREKEMEIRNLISTRLERGKVDFNLWTEKEDGANATPINATILAGYYRQIESISRNMNIPLPTDWFATLLRLPEVMNRTETEELTEEEWAAVKSAIEEAIDKLTDFRRQEGVALHRKFCEKLDNIETLMLSIEPYEKMRTEKIRQRLTDALAAIPEVEYDRNRLEQEMIYYIEKLDINEEKQRLFNHLKYFRETMENGHGQGKKLGFIAQEMGREINTTGSKSNQAEMQNIVVKMKDELEQIKEQVLNVM